MPAPWRSWRGNKRAPTELAKLVPRVGLNYDPVITDDAYTILDGLVEQGGDARLPRSPKMATAEPAILVRATY